MTIPGYVPSSEEHEPAKLARSIRNLYEYFNSLVAVGTISSVVIQKFTSSGTYTPTAGMQYCIIECVGGGGGGGGVTGVTNNFFIGGGGGSGGYSRAVKTAADIGASKAVTIGALGAGGAAGSNSGAAGGATSVGTLCIANGGLGGVYSSAVSNGAGGAGGANSGAVGNITADGMPGQGGFYNIVNNTIATNAGGGGSSYFGGGGFSGGAGSNYGGGGAGATVSTAVNVAGGNGSAGIVIITEFL